MQTTGFPGTGNMVVAFPFLKLNKGVVFQPVFKNLRFQHIICDLASTRVIEQDALIPSEWLSCVYKQQWFTLLRAQQYREIGPRDINETELEEYSMRCGKDRQRWKILPGSGLVTTSVFTCMSSSPATISFSKT